MRSRIRRALCATVVIPALYVTVSSSAEAFTVTTHRVVIDNARSSVTYLPGMVFAVGETAVSQPVTMGISGTFDVFVQEYEWERPPFGGGDGAFQPPPLRERWMSFGNPQFTLDQPGFDFEFPGYMVRMSGISFSGGNGPCSFPSPPGSHCTGVSNYIPAHMEGTFDGQALNIEAATTSHGFLGDERFSYRLSASVVPLPSSMLLLGSSLLTFLLTRIFTTEAQRTRRCLN